MVCTKRRTKLQKNVSNLRKMAGTSKVLAFYIKKKGRGGVCRKVDVKSLFLLLPRLKIGR
jgi:hypothetical protein